MDTAQVQAVRRECVARVMARRPDPAVTEAKGADGVSLSFDRTPVNAIREPRDVGEFLDFEIASLPHKDGPVAEIVVGILIAARDSVAAAVKAVGAAAGHDPWDQFAACVSLAAMAGRTKIPDAQLIMSAVTDEWHRRKLPDSPPTVLIPDNQPPSRRSLPEEAPVPGYVTDRARRKAARAQNGA